MKSHKITKRLVTVSAMLLLFVGVSYSQTYTISGTQTKGHGNNAKLDCKAVAVKKTVKIYSVSGDNNGFWIMKNGTTIKKYWKQNDASAKGLTLKPGTYYVYPNLKNNQKKASVILKLK